MNARDAIARELWALRAPSGWEPWPSPEDEYPDRATADALVAALEAAGFTVARLEQVGWQDAEFIWPIGMRSGDVTTDAPVFRIIPEETNE